MEIFSTFVVECDIRCMMVDFMNQEEIIRRQDLAESLFKDGFNCAQAVFAACADLYDIEQPQALRLAASFGGGIGRMRQTCGAACGMFLLAGLQTGSTTPHDAAGKQYNYTVVQRLADAFKQENGSLICSDLLGLNTAHPATEKASATHPQPEARTEKYYQKRPCVEMVRSAVKIYLEALGEL